jgi:hypothetical protein
MAKRFTETEIWNDPWYRKLSAEEKVVWKFICDRCDSAGFWKKDFDLATFLCTFQVTNEHFKGINKGKERVKDHGEHIQIVDFIKFQYGVLSENCKPHKPVIALLKNYERKGYLKGIHTLEEQEQEQDKEQDKERGYGGEPKQPTPSELSQEFFSKGNYWNELLDLFSKDKDRKFIENEFNKFYVYWTEPNKSGTKVRYELETTFDVKRRLFTWLNRIFEKQRSVTNTGRGLA